MEAQHVHAQHCPVGDKVKCVIVLLLAALAFMWLGVPKYTVDVVGAGEYAYVVRSNRFTGSTQRIESCRLSLKDEEEYRVLDKRSDMTDKEWARYKQLQTRRNAPCWVDVKSDSGADVEPEKSKD